MAIKDSSDDVKKPDDSEDNFGLPDLDYKPLDQKEEATHTKEEVTSTPTSTYTSSESTTYKSSYDDDSSSVDDDDEPKSKAPLILGIVIVLVLVVSGYLIYNFVIKPRQLAAAEKVKKELLAKASADKAREEEARLAAERERERLRLDSLAKAKPAIGTIETLSGRTRRYYVVVTSDIDDDLLMDYAKKLSAKGISTKIIPPFGSKEFFRLSIADAETFTLAQTSADAAKAEYGGEVWVIKY